MVSIRTDKLTRLQALTDAALAHLDLEELLSALLLRTREMLDVDTCAVLLLDEATDELVARAAVGIEEEVEQGVRIPLGMGFAGRVAAWREPVILDDVDHAEVLNPILHQKGIKSMLGVPLIVGGTVLGVLHVGVLKPRRFTTEDTELLQLAGDRAALAIEHARAFAAERRARERLEDLQAVSDDALGSLDVTELLDVLLPRIRTILHADTCAVLLLHEATDELVARAAVGIEEEVEQGVRIPVGGGFAGRVAAEQRPVILSPLTAADVLNPILLDKGITSMCGVPLFARTGVIGVLHVGTLTPHTFTESEVELLQLVASRVAVAIERASLHEEMLLLDRMRANFVAIASHELRTPAASVYGVLKTLAARGSELSPALRDELLDTGVQQSERLRRLLEELLDLSRLDSNTIQIAPEPVVVRTVIEKIARDVMPGTPFTLQVPDDLAAIADPHVLDRVLSNLLLNAKSHGAPPLLVTAERRDRHLRIAVSDEGLGVPEELQPQLFERFVRGRDAQGSGLGLAISRTYARAHGGELLYNPSGSGARFELVIPQSS